MLTWFSNLLNMARAIYLLWFDNRRSIRARSDLEHRLVGLGRPAVPVLRRGLRHPDPAIRLVSARALLRIDRGAAGDALERMGTAPEQFIETQRQVLHLPRSEADRPSNRPD